MSIKANANVDKEEIAKFEEIASVWWDKEGQFKPLHQINPLRLAFINEHCDGLFGKDIVDVGCGGGILSESMAVQGAQVSGLDAGLEPLNVARLHSLETGVKVDYQHTTAEDFAADNAEKFDIVTCMEMLEHVPEPASIIQACADMLKPGGKAYFSTLNRNLKSWLLAIVAAENILKWVPQGTHDHEKFIKPSELMGWLEACNLKVRDVTGIHYNPLQSQFYLSDSNVDVNYIIYAEKLS